MIKLGRLMYINRKSAKKQQIVGKKLIKTINQTSFNKIIQVVLKGTKCTNKVAASSFSF